VAKDGVKVIPFFIAVNALRVPDELVPSCKGIILLYYEKLLPLLHIKHKTSVIGKKGNLFYLVDAIFIYIFFLYKKQEINQLGSGLL